MSSQLFPGPPMWKLSVRTTTLSYTATLPGRSTIVSSEGGYRGNGVTSLMMPSAPSVMPWTMKVLPIPFHNALTPWAEDFYHLINILIWKVTWTTPALNMSGKINQPSTWTSTLWLNYRIISPPVGVFRYLNFGDGVHDVDGTEWSQVVSAGVVVYLEHIYKITSWSYIMTKKSRLEGGDPYWSSMSGLKVLHLIR